VVDPDLHTDRAHRRARFGGAEIDLRSQRVQRHAAFAVPLAPTHLRAAEPARRGDPHAERTRAHRGLHRSAHRPAERHTALELLGHPLREQRGVGLGAHLARGLVHVLDLHVDPLLRVALDVLPQPVDLSTLAPDHDAGARRADEHPDLVTLALDVDRGDARSGQP
jgi:hypothetical protein